MDVGFIGLGRMGSNMARNLAKAGHQVAVYDLRQEAITALAETPNIRGARSVAEAAGGAEVVGTSLPGPREVEEVALRAGGLRDSMRSGATYVDLSTNSPTLIRRVEKELASKGISMLDTPVSGGVTGAEAGTLTIMVGGDAALFERMKPFLSGIGSKLFYCGAIGNGQVAKLCNNLAGESYAVILAEILTLGVRGGVDLKTLVNVIGNSTGRSPRLTQAFPRGVFRREFGNAFFPASLMAKDVHLALELAHDLGVPVTMSEQVDHDMRYVIEKGWGDLTFDVVVRAQEDRTGVELRLTPEELEELNFS